MAKKEIIEEEIKCEGKCVKIDPLAVSFNSEDMNKVVEKINEIITKCQ